MTSEAPNYHQLNREELIKLLDRLRNFLAIESPDDFYMEAADLLDLDLGLPGV